MDLMWGLNKNCLFLGLTLKTVSIRHTQEVLFELLIIMEVLGTTHYVRTDVNFELTDFGFSSRNPNCAAHSTVLHNGRNFQILSKKVFPALDKVFHIYLMRILQKYVRNWIPLWATQGSVANPAHAEALFSLSCCALKKQLLRDLNFLDNFAIPSSSRHGLNISTNSFTITRIFPHWLMGFTL